jgi:hypothetical protein
MDLKAEIEKCGKGGVISLVLAIFGASGFFGFL